jgi:hypothetical protein
MELLGGRAYSAYGDQENVRLLLNDLLTTTSSELYQKTMTDLGVAFGHILGDKIDSSSKCLVAATAEDADYLASGLISSLKSKHEIMAAIFWNNHYSIESSSVAPIVHKYLQPGFETAKSLILVKSVLSGSCVVRANMLSLIESMDLEKIFVVAPVVHEKSEESLKSEFPEKISSLFEFIYFAKDQVKDESGEVKPGIGGQIYQLLGMMDQPAKIGYMPKLVERLAFGA